jgi:hypothetical protein
MPHPDFAKAATHVTAHHVRDLLVDLVNIPSTTGQENGVAHYLVDRMRKSGMDTDLPLVDADRPNAVGHRRGRGDGLNLLFTGHMDTSYSGQEEHLVGEGFQPKAIHRDGWVYEEKYDGWRMVAEKAGSQVTLTSRNGLDHTKRFPELVKAVEELDAPSLILDGEIAIFDRQLISRFEWLRARPKHELATPPMYMDGRTRTGSRP